MYFCVLYIYVCIYIYIYIYIGLWCSLLFHLKNDDIYEQESITVFNFLLLCFMLVESNIINIDLHKG